MFFFEQLGYIVGTDIRDKILLEYYKQWRYKHPNANDFFRIAEKVSNLQLDWYKQYWINFTKTIDYAIDSIWAENGKTKIQLSMKGKMPMPIDLTIKYKDNKTEIAYIPQYLMFGSKSSKETSLKVTKYEPWKWTSPTYIITLDNDISQISAIEIDESQRMADVNRENNKKVLATK